MNCTIASGTPILDTTLTSGTTAVFYNYAISDCGTNRRAGILTIIYNQSATTAALTDNATASLGSTTGIVFSASINAGSLELTATIPNNSFKFTFVKTVLDDCCTIPSQQILTEGDDNLITESTDNLFTN